MEWATVQHLDLRHVGRGLKPLQPHTAAFHPSQAIIAAAIGTYIIEFDALTGSKIASIDIGAPVVRMAYSPTSGHTVVAVLEDCTIRSCDFDMEQTSVLHSPEKRTEQISSDTEVHLALTPLQPVVFFGFHRRMSVTVVGTVEGGRAPTKIKTDLKKPIVNLACHPRLPVLYVAYADGLIRAYNIQTYAVLYTLQLDQTIKLIGAGAFAFHPMLEWIFVGDRRGTLLAWDVSTERPNMIGITQVGSHSIISISWISMLRVLVTLSKDGVLQVWKTRVSVNPHRQPLQANFFEPAAIETIDVTRILTLQDGEAVYPLPRIKSLIVHPKLNLATLLFANVASGDIRNRAAFTREGRKQLFAVLQSAKGSTATVLKEKLSSLGSSGILADHQLQTKLQEHHLKGNNQLTISDIARKAFLHSHFLEGHAKGGPISRLPIITILNANHQSRDVPVCQPFHLELNFFNKENRVLHYPVRAFYLDGPNLMAYNLCSGVDGIHKKLYTNIPGNVECCPKSILYSSKQNLFLTVFEFNSSMNEVVVYREQTDFQSANSKASTIKGLDAAFVGSNDNQYVILEDDRTSLVLYILPGASVQEATANNGALDPNSFSDANVATDRGPLQFAFESEVDRIFSSPLESTVMYACHGNHIGLAKLVQGYRISTDDGQNISTKTDGKRSIKLRANEIVLQVHWQETLRGQVAGILTSQRVMIASADLEILSSSFVKFDKGLPSFRSLLWVGPALLFSSATAVRILGWDSKVRTILSISMPYSVLVGALNDRLLFLNPTEINPRQKKAIEIRSCLVGLLEPLLIGFATMQQNFEQKLDLSEILYQITSRFDSLRITPRSLDILARGSPVCGDLALALSQAGPQFTQVLRCMYAIKALRFSTALSVLKDEFLRSRDYPQCPPTSHLFHRFRQLGYACIKYGQFDSAKETFEVIADFESMLDLFICHLNPSAMRRLAQKLEDVGTDSELRRYCERILRVRSTGWTQGIFANFAAESMVPKGPEWGGGNWEIKTPTQSKPLPQWELAGEVMPYMKTSDGAIPSIIVDHIGIYLGAIKGRGNVIDVREDSLVKKFTAAGSENQANGSQLSLVNKANGVGNAATKDNFSVGKETLARQFASAAAVDEQAKAEEEFKKSLYGTADGSSSEEDEGMTRTKKIQIRIRDKPVAAPTVDVNKIKEATRQFRLGEALAQPPRTRSLSGGSQDLALMLSQPAPTVATNAPITSTAATTSADVFGNDVTLLTPIPVTQPSPLAQLVPPTQPSQLAQPVPLTQPLQLAQPVPPTQTLQPVQPATMMMGVGISAGPIPEDFFHNTISSLRVAASVPASGGYLSRFEQNAQGVSGNVSSAQGVSSNVPFAQDFTSNVPSVQGMPSAVNTVPDIGLPDGGVPPRASQLSASSQSIGLPDGGVPPQAQVQPGQTPMASQPIDLSALGVPGLSTGADAAKSQPNPASTAAVRPGQVPRGAAASVCFKTALAHIEQNQLPDALSCLDEAFLALAKDQSRGGDIRAQATICAQYKIAVALLQEIARLQKVQGPSAISAKDEMARLSRHLSSLPLQAKHRINCIRTAIKRNMEVQNYAYAKQMLELLLSKAPVSKQDELRSLIDMCIQRGMYNKSIDPLEDPSQFCAATLSRLSTIGHDVCDLCGAKFSALSTPGCIICGMGSIKRSDALAGPVPSPFG